MSIKIYTAVTTKNNDKWLKHPLKFCTDIPSIIYIINAIIAVINNIEIESSFNITYWNFLKLIIKKITEKSVAYGWIFVVIPGNGNINGDKHTKIKENLKNA